MKFLARTLLVLSGAGLLGCSSNSKAKKLPRSLSQVSFALGGCYDSCHFLAVRVDSQLTYQYYCQDTSRWYGKTHAYPQGYCGGQVSRVFWDTLVAKVERARLVQDNLIYPDPQELVQGGLQVEWVIDTPGHRTHLRGQRGSGPAAVTELETWLGTSYQQVALQASPDSLHFITSYQYPSKPPPFPKLGGQ